VPDGAIPKPVLAVIWRVVCIVDTRGVTERLQIIVAVASVRKSER